MLNLKKSSHRKKNHERCFIVFKIRSLIAQLSIISMISFPLNSFGSDTSWGPVIMGILNQGGQIASQAVNQSLAAKQMASMMTSMQPNIIPAKYFPHCKISPARPDLPVNACRSVVDQASAKMAFTFTMVAVKYDKMYDQLLSEAQNSLNPPGIQCLKNAQKNLGTEIQGKINGLQAMANQLNKNFQMFDEYNQNILEQMRKINGELTGQGNSIDDKSRDMALYFNDAACKEVLSSNLLGTPGIGLRGIKESFMVPREDGPSLRETARNMISDAPNLEKQIAKQIERMKKDIKAKGIQDWEKSGVINSMTRGGLTKFKGIESVIRDKVTDFHSAYERIANELKDPELMYELPPLDGHFRKNVSTFAREAKETFKKRVVHNCVTTADSTGSGLSVGEILNGLQIQGTGNSGTTIINFKNRLEPILSRIYENKANNADNRRYVYDELKNLEQLQKSIGGGEVRVLIDTPYAGRQRLTPYELFREAIRLCEAKYTDEKITSAEYPSGITFKEKVEKATRYLNEALELEEKFANDIAEAIQEQITTCGEENSSKLAGSCSNPQMMDTSNENFCLSTAKTCAQNVAMCFNKASALVQDRETKIKLAASEYNKNVRGLVAGQEQLLAQIKAQVLKDANFFKAYFPGAKYEFPKDLFVAMPKMEMSDEFGVQLLGGGDLSRLKQGLPSQIEALQALMRQQEEGVNKVISEYINQQKNAMMENRQTWAQIRSDCEAAITAFNQQNSQTNEKNAEEWKAMQQEVGNFCVKYNNLLNSNPAAGCGGDYSPENLQGDMAKVVSFLAPDVRPNLSAYSNLCAQAQASSDGESSDEEDLDDDAKERQDSIIDLCRKKKNSWDRVTKVLNKQILDSTADEDQEKVRECLKDSSKDCSDLGNELLSDSIKSYQELIDYAKDLEGKPLQKASENKVEKKTREDSLAQAKGKLDTEKKKTTTLETQKQESEKRIAELQQEITKLGTKAAKKKEVNEKNKELEEEQQKLAVLNGQTDQERVTIDKNIKDINAEIEKLKEPATEQKEGTYSKNLCESIKKEIAILCLNEDEGKARNECISKDILDVDWDSLKVASEANDIFKQIVANGEKSNSVGLGRQWSYIGEMATGRCTTQDAGSRQMADDPLGTIPNEAEANEALNNSIGK